MSGRFFAILGRRRSIDGSGHPLPRISKLQIYECGKEVVVATDARDNLIVLPNESGFIVGTLFERHGPSRPVHEMSPSEVEAITATSGKHLIDRYWGRYVAVIHAANRFFVLRDPSGTLPCLYVKTKDAVSLASEPSLLLEAGRHKAEVDTSAIARTLFRSGLPEERTALANVCQLLPGMALHVHGSRTNQAMLWNPWDFVSPEHELGSEEYVEKLSRVTQQCVSGWGGLYDRSLLSASGGLDSSIVAACFQRRGVDFSCATISTQDPLGEDRRAIGPPVGG